MNWNQVPCGRMDKACAMLAKSLCGVGDTRFESVSRALTFLTENVFYILFIISNFKFHMTDANIIRMC